MCSVCLPVSQFFENLSRKSPAGSIPEPFDPMVLALTRAVGLKEVSEADRDMVRRVKEELEAAKAFVGGDGFYAYRPLAEIVCNGVDMAHRCCVCSNQVSGREKLRHICDFI